MNIENYSKWCCFNQEKICQEKIQEETAENFMVNIHKQKSNEHKSLSPDSTTNKHDILKYFKGQESQTLPSSQRYSRPISTLQTSKSLNSLSSFKENSFRITNQQSKPSFYNTYQVNSPRIVYVEKVKKQPTKIYSNLYSLKIQPGQSKTKLSLRSSARMQGKRIKTEEDTQYSSTNSRILWRNSNEGFDNVNKSCFQKKKNEKGKPYSPFFNQSIENLEFPSCKEVSPREQVDTESQNIRSVHTIGTSPQMRSKRTSRQPSSLLTFAKIFQSPPQRSPKESSEIPQYLTSKSPIVEASLDSRYQSPRFSTKTLSMNSPTKYTSLGLLTEAMQGSKISSSLFYNEQTSSKNDCDQKLSYLSILDITDKENSEEQEELRDVIDHSVLAGTGFSKTSIPSGLGSHSLKNVEDRKQKKIQIIGENSSNSSVSIPSDLKLLTQMRMSQKRTNTFESFDTSLSEKSQLDIKFMQKHRTRREVSKLI